jgi:hypothetical protein
MKNDLNGDEEQVQGQNFATKNINELPTHILFIVYLVSNIFSRLIDGLVGDGIGLFSLICLLLTITKFVKDKLSKKEKGDHMRPGVSIVIWLLIFVLIIVGLTVEL